MEQKIENLKVLAEITKVDTKDIVELMKKNVMPAGCSDSELGFALAIAAKYNLNPFTNEICFIRTKNGRLIPYVQYDGWVKITRTLDPESNIIFEENFDGNGKIFSVTCQIISKKGSVKVTEYYQECFIPNRDAWVKYPIRMLRNKSFNQAARLQFGISGIYDEDEMRRIIESENRNNGNNENKILPEPEIKSLPEQKSEPNQIAQEKIAQPTQSAQSTQPTQTTIATQKTTKKKINISEGMKQKLVKAKEFIGQEKFDNIISDLHIKKSDINDDIGKIILKKVIDLYGGAQC